MLLAQQYLSAKNYAMDLITRFYKNAKDTHDNSYSIGFNFKVNVKVYIRHRIAQKKNSMYPFYTHAAPAVHHHTKKKTLNHGICTQHWQIIRLMLQKFTKPKKCLSHLLLPKTY